MKLLSVVGARPQFVKLAPVCRAIGKVNEGGEARISHSIVHTGQHFDPEMSERFFSQLGIPQPECNLAVGASSTPAEQLAHMLERLEPVLQDRAPDWVIVYGDTNSTLAAAVAGTRAGYRVAHVEAGCRSHRIDMPEEQNRIVADHLARLLFTVSQRATQTLHREGIGTVDDPLRREIVWAGDLMYDTLMMFIELADGRAEATLRQLGVTPGSYYLLTVHRADNVNRQRLRAILDAAEALDFPVVFPVHPRTRAALNGDAQWRRNVHICEPLGYLEMLALQKHAHKVLTDSGGVQKEAFFLGVPCITLRNETEWPETVEAGANRLVGTCTDKILDAALRWKPSLQAGPREFGDGRAAERIVQGLAERMAA